MNRWTDTSNGSCRSVRKSSGSLKDTGSFVLDIGGAWVPGVPVRSVYHFELAVKLAKSFHLGQEFYWFNPARLPTPAEWVTVRRLRVKDAVNMIWWFGKTEWPNADNKRVLQPYSESMRGLIRNGYTAKKRPSGHDISTKFQKDNGGAIPPNLIQIANTESNSATFASARSGSSSPTPPATLNNWSSSSRLPDSQGRLGNRPLRRPQRDRGRLRPVQPTVDRIR